MKEVFFTLPSRKSIPTVRIEYGPVDKNFIVRIFDGRIYGRLTSEDYPMEEIFLYEQEMLRKVNEIKKGLLESRWVILNKESISQPTFLKTGIVDGAISFEFSVNIDPVKLDRRKKGIAKDFAENLGKEIEKHMRNVVK